MADDVDDLLGSPADRVPKREPDEKCRGKRTKNRDGESVFIGYCKSRAGKGTDHVGEGRCKHHGGCNGEANGQGAPEDNTNAATHGAYVEFNSYYQNVLDERMQQFVDDVFADYLEQYRELHGDPVLGIETELFRISVTHAKDIGLDRWADEKPKELDSGHPLVDKETSRKQIGDRIVKERRYRESVVQAAQGKLSRDRRQWLKDLGLLEDPESQKADAITDLKTAWVASAQSDSS